MEYFSATSDVWSRSNRSFIAVSVHYIDSVEETECVKTQFIACELFEGRHTNDKVAEKLNQIFTRFGILEKVFFLTTDGAGEYVAACKYHGDNYRSIQPLAVDEDDINWFSTNNNSGSENIAGQFHLRSASQRQNLTATATTSNPSGHRSSIYSDSDSDDDDSIIDADDFVRGPSGSDLPTNTNDNFFIEENPLFALEDTEASILANINRIGCSSHALDKVGSIDSEGAKNDPEYAAIHAKVFEKLHIIWAQKESRLSAEIFTHITGRKLIGPHNIRWLKTFDAVSFFLSFIMIFLVDLCQ